MNPEKRTAFLQNGNLFERYKPLLSLIKKDHVTLKTGEIMLKI